MNFKSDSLVFKQVIFFLVLSITYKNRIVIFYFMHVGGFATFADFLFDGILADAYMSSKIFSSLEQVRMLRKRLYDLRDFLQR